VRKKGSREGGSEKRGLTTNPMMTRSGRMD